MASDGAAARGWQVDERERAAAIAAYDLEALRDGAALRRITDFAAALCDAPVALVTVLEESRQSFLSRTGTDLTETPRELSFCRFTVLDDEVMVVPDLARDPRFADNALVIGEPHARFYAGAPLFLDDGVAIGALCVLDTTPHPDGLTPVQRQGLETLAESVVARLRDHRDAAAWRRTEGETQRRLLDSEQRFRTLADAMPQMVWSALPDGNVDYWNARWYEFTGVPVGSTDGEAWDGVFHPDDRERTWSTWRHSLATGEPYEIEYRLRHVDGLYRWVLGRALPIREADGTVTRWFGTCTDIHEQKLALEQREVVSEELSHRIKNIFAVISGLIGVAVRGRPEFAALAGDLRERITALGRAHDFVRPHSPQSRPMARQDSLHGLFAELFAPYARDGMAGAPSGGGGGGIVVTGDDLPIDDRSATPLALLFHELATNATKYGALAAGGLVDVAIAVEGEAVTLTWRERGGPVVAEPTAGMGFGSQLVELSGVRQLGGTVSRDWRQEGLVVTIRAPRASFSRRNNA